jgi:hypothetical protein
MAAQFRATVKESGQGRPWIWIELNEDIDLKPDQNIVLQFDEGTPISKVEEVARYLNANVGAIRTSKF